MYSFKNSLALAVRDSEVASLLPWAVFVVPCLVGKDPMDWYKGKLAHLQSPILKWEILCDTGGRNQMVQRHSPVEMRFLITCGDCLCKDGRIRWLDYLWNCLRRDQYVSTAPTTTARKIFVISNKKNWFLWWWWFQTIALRQPCRNKAVQCLVRKSSIDSVW